MSTLAWPAPADRSGLPSPAKALGREAFRDLERWLSSPSSRRLRLLGVERETELRGQEVLRLMLQAHIDGRGTGDVGVALCARTRAGGEVLYTHKRLHTRRLVTVFGEVSITRTGYSCPGQPSLHPLDAELQLPARIYSYEIQRRLVKAAVQGPFDEAVRLLVEMNGIEAPKRSAEQLVIDAAIDFERFYAQRSGSRCAVEGAILVGAIDCKGIPMVKLERVAKTVRMGKGKKRQKKRMSTVAAVFCQRPEPRTAEEVVASPLTLTGFDPHLLT